ncbi:hypothetical protein ACJMK2_044527 [Sinanodonta woodiana]|uniref:G-protein coupled receptors family 1 profile domain-containing protein n=1 Tax=Sinanodonta woodiana TaxID=1069815 RepID=A0ABD3W3L6_SINWO
MCLRRSNIGRIQKARIRTFKMTLVIVIAFIVCWTPYFFISAIWWFDKELARTILDQKVQRGLFIFAISNSCVNPIIYGMFTTSLRKEAARWKALFQRRLSRMGLHATKQHTLEQHIAMT